MHRLLNILTLLGCSMLAMGILWRSASAKGQPTEVVSLEDGVRLEAPQEVPEPWLDAQCDTSHLPGYELDIHLDTSRGRATVQESIRWTNPGPCATDRILLHVYPRHRPNAEQKFIYERTLESFRIDPESGVDVQGRRLHIHEVTSEGISLSFDFDAEHDTLMVVMLPAPLEPGVSIELELDFDIDLPPVQGRFGQYLGVTNLLNWYPLLAYYDENGWYAPPFVAWHQPWINEAGNYEIMLHLPAGEQVASGGQVIQRTVDEEGQQHLRIVGHGLRDLAIVTSKRYEVHEAEVCGVKVRVLAFPKHRFFARHALRTAIECLELYSQWFGPYPYSEFEIAETYLGWNGNETAGMILIDQRAFQAPHMGHVYIDHLVSHEICHQWWYAAVGTDGFRESWMDEGLVTYFTELRTRRKYGKDVELLDWPRHFTWLPNVSYHTFAHMGYHLYRERGGKGKVLAPLPEIGHVHNLFFLAYDRGNKVVGMIHQRLGEKKFFEFLRMVYSKYRFRVMFVADFQQELEEFTGQSWQVFFDDWLCSPKIADWKVDRVKVKRVESPELRVESPESRVQSPELRVESPESRVESPESRVQSRQSRVQSPESRVQSPEQEFRTFRLSTLNSQLSTPSSLQPQSYHTTVLISQRAEIDEPVEIEIELKTPDGPTKKRWFFRPEDAEVLEFDEYRVIRVGEHKWRLEFFSEYEPRQIVIDPDMRILDENRFDNRWKKTPKVRLTPLFTPVDEVPLAHPLDRLSIVAGPNIDVEGRVGLRAALIASNRFRVSTFVAYQHQNEHPWLTMGVDSIIRDFPKPKLSLGARYEHTLTSNVFDDPRDQGWLYLRWNQKYTTSFIYENHMFTELYFRFGDNFFPDPDIRPPTIAGVEDYRSIRALGLRFHLDTYLPYWNPRKGFRFEVQVENGFELFGDGESYNRAWAQFGAARELPGGLGCLSRTRLAGRVAGGIGSPDNGEHFRFGGPKRFRGQRSEDVEGNAFWLASAEWRFPIIEDMDLSIADNVGNLRSLYAATFYDIGQSYLFDRYQDLDHAVGAGLYFEISILSFLEQLTLRLEYGYSLRHDTSVAWLGFYRAF